MKKLVIAVTLGLTSASLFASESTTIRFGVDPTFAPFESKNASGQLVGFDIDLGNAICQKLKAKCVWVENAFEGIIPALQAKKFDAILSAMSVNEKRREQIDFTDRLYNGISRLVAKKGSNILPTPAALKGAKVGIAQGSIQEAYAKAYWSPKGIEIVSYQNQDLVYQDMIAGRIDATLTDAVQADVGFLKTPQGQQFAFAGANVIDKKTMGDEIAIGLRKGDAALQTTLNRALAALHKDGTYDRLQRKYFSFDIYK